GLIAFAIMGSKGAPNTVANNNGAQNTGNVEVEITPVSDKDHIRGNPDADIIVVEYSDYQCPFCQQFHGTMQTLLDAYGKDGKIAWAYRHYPVHQVHALARPASELAECVASVSGNDAFWSFTDALFEHSPASLSETEMDKIMTAQNSNVADVKA